MPQSTTASAVFTNQHAAKRAVQRLAEGGFARASIAMHRVHSDDDSYEVSVRVREANVRRADDLLHARAEVQGFGGRSVDVGPLLLLTGAIVAGAAGYALYASRRRGRARGNRDSLPFPSVW